LVHRCVGIPGISDHDTIAYVEIPSKAIYQKPTRRKIFIWKNADITDIKVKQTRVQKLLNNINPPKGTGPDNIPGKLLKELATEISPILTTIRVKIDPPHPLVLVIGD
jgi:hypothetical protein